MSAPIFDWLAHRALVLPAHPAVVAGGETVSFAELARRASALATRLRASGVAPGDCVALLGHNSADFVAAVHAVPRTGAILLPLNARLGPDELGWQLRDAGVRILLHDDAAAPLATKAAATANAACVPLAAPELAAEAAADASLQFEHEPDDPFAVIYTSGTTGSPKGARLTYANFQASAAASAFNLGVLPSDRWIACMPMFHVGGLSIVTRSAIYGTTVVVHAAFDEHAVNAELRDRGASLLSVVATMLRRMLDADDLPYPPTVRGVLVGGGPVDESLLRRAADRGLPVLQTYGLTETTSQVTTLAPADALAHLGAAGKPLLGTRVRVDAAPGEPGEILVRGAVVTAGYLNRPDATARALRDGWLHTGDIGRLDLDGFLYVLDRRDDLIVSGGENVYPAEVEQAARACPGVADLAVIGLPDERWGQVVAAAVVPAETFDEAAFVAFLRARLAGYKVPRIVRTVEALPVTASGKVRRNVVREWFTPR